MFDIYDAGTDIEVSFTLRLPERASIDEIDKWVKFEVGSVSTFDVRNALNDHELHGNTRDVRVAAKWRGPNDVRSRLNPEGSA